MSKKGSKKGSNFHGALGASFNPRTATVATTIQITELSCDVASPLLSNPYPQQDILRLAGIQCHYSLRPQPVVQSWKLHHRGKMVLFQWKSTTLLKHSSAARSMKNSDIGGTFPQIKNHSRMFQLNLRIDMKCPRVEEVTKLYMNNYLIKSLCVCTLECKSHDS